MGLLALTMIFTAGCERVLPGEVGLKISQYGDAKGDIEVLDTGKYYYWPWTHDFEKYPTTEKTFEFEGITFQTGDSLTVSTPKASVVLEITKDRELLVQLWKTHRKDFDDLVSTVVTREVLSAINLTAGEFTAADVVGTKKTEFARSVLQKVQATFGPAGLTIKSVQFTSGFIPPPEVEASIKAKVASVQDSEKRENEIRTAEASAKIKVIEAEAVAASTLAHAKATAEANRLVAQSLTPELVQFETVNKWNGQLPQVSGSGTTPLVNLGALR